MIYINFETSNVPAALQDLKALGFTYIASRAAPSWNGREPETLIVASHDDIPDSHRGVALYDFRRALRRLSENHQQDCIAVLYADGTGECIGSQPVPFDIKYFTKS
jgi:hypothetical protein